MTPWRLRPQAPHLDLVCLRVLLAGLILFLSLKLLSPVVLRTAHGGDASQAPLCQSDCVESASEQVGVLRARPKSGSGLKACSISSKSSNRLGGWIVGPRVQLPGVKRLASPSGTLWGESASTSSERSSGQLPLGQSLVSVSTSVLRQDPVQQVSAPIGTGGHDVVSRTHHQSSSDCRPSSSPVNG